MVVDGMGEEADSEVVVVGGACLLPKRKVEDLQEEGQRRNDHANLEDLYIRVDDRGIHR